MKRICLFDIDGTLAQSRLKIKEDMKETLRRLTKVVDVGFVGGSDAVKIKEQLDEDTISLGKYFFPENGLVAYKEGQQISRQSIGSFLSEAQLQKLLNFCLHYIADLNIPIKRGTFIEYRTGLINVSPIGRNCSQSEREAFFQYDKKHHIRETFIQRIQKEFPDLGLKYSIGGQISFDVFPIGWDKTYCLRFVNEYEEVHFFGDKTDPGGNDHEIYEQIRKTGRAYSIREGPSETISLLEKLFLSQ